MDVQYREMRYFTPPTPLVLSSDFNPEECARRLREAIDAERPTVFGFSGYRGSKPFLGNVEGKQFRVLQRIYSNRNSFPTVLTGEFEPQGTRTRVNGIFDLELTSKIAICLFAAVGLLILAPIIMISYRSQPVLLAACVCGYGSLLFFMPRIVRSSGRDEERSIADFIRATLQADDDLSRS
jgi:hypothetical protein